VSDRFSSAFETRLFAAKIVAGATLASVAVYTMMVATLSRQPLGGEAPISGDAKDVLRTVIYGAAIADGVLATVLTRLLRPRPGTTDPTNRLFAASVVALALAEAVGIFGVMLFFLTRVPSEAYPLFVLSAALILFHFPNARRWQEASRRTSPEIHAPD